MVVSSVYLSRLYQALARALYIVLMAAHVIQLWAAQGAALRGCVHSSMGVEQSSTLNKGVLLQRSQSLLS